MRTAVAGVIGALQSLLVLALVAVLGVPLARAGLTWYARGSLEPVPLATRDGELPVRVIGANAAEARAVREAAGRLRYRPDPRAITFVVVEQVSSQPDNTGEYMPLLDVVRLERSVVREGGERLEWTVGHEVGHYADQRFLTNADRTAFRRLRGIPDNVSWTANDRPWEDRPIEDFAECFAEIAVPSPIRPPSTLWGPLRQPQRFERLLAQAGIRLDRELPPSGLLETARREAFFVRQVAADPVVGVEAAALLGLYLGLGMVPSMIRAWTRSPADGTTADRRETPPRRYRRPVHRAGHHPRTRIE
jgi:hypothetical protein